MCHSNMVTSEQASDQDTPEPELAQGEQAGRCLSTRSWAVSSLVSSSTGLSSLHFCIFTQAAMGAQGQEEQQRRGRGWPRDGLPALCSWCRKAQRCRTHDGPTRLTHDTRTLIMTGPKWLKARSGREWASSNPCSWVCLQAGPLRGPPTHNSPRQTDQGSSAAQWQTPHNSA